MLVFRGVMDSFCSDSDSPPQKKNSQNKVTPRHTPVYRAACRLYTAYFPNLSSLIIHTDSYDIGLETYWKMIPPQPKNLHNTPPDSVHSTDFTLNLNATNAARRSTFASQPSAIQHLLGSIAPSCEAGTLWSGESTDYPWGEPWGDVGMLIFGGIWKWKHRKMCVYICFVY